jgi:hypothetical protein
LPTSAANRSVRRSISGGADEFRPRRGREETFLRLTIATAISDRPRMANGAERRGTARAPRG